MNKFVGQYSYKQIEENFKKVENINIDMHTNRFNGMRYNSFFGAHGSLPLAFTERILYFSQAEHVFDFFDRVFAELILKNESKYYEIVHSYIRLFKRKEKSNYNYIKIVKINNKFNTLGVSKLSKMILGRLSPVFTNNNTAPLGKIGMILK